MTIQMAYTVVFLTSFLTSCLNSNCTKIPLRKNELNWFQNFKEGDTLYFQSEKNVDTFVCGKVFIGYTPCNKFELGEFQHNEASLSIFDLKNNYRIGILFSKDGQEDTISNCFKSISFDKFENNTRDDYHLEEITLRNGKKYYCVILNSDNTQSYIEQVYWSKDHGLIKYVNSNKETYELVK